MSVIDTWKFQQLSGIIIFSVIILYLLYKKFALNFWQGLGCVLFFFIFLKSILHIFTEIYYIDKLPPILNAQLQIINAESILILILSIAVIAFVQLPIRAISNIFLFVFSLDGVWLLLGNKYGLMQAHSFDTGIMACLLPFTLYYSPPFSKLKFSCAIFLTSVIAFKGGATGILIALLVWTIFINDRYLKLNKALVLGMLFSTISIVIYLSGSNFLDPSGRPEMWVTWFDWYSKNAASLGGTGLGSFELLGPLLPVNGISYKFMHNDFLQVVFELGLSIGICFLIFVLSIIWSVRHNAAILSMCLGYFILMMTYFPLHFFLSQLLGIFFLRMAWGYNRLKNQSNLD